MKASGTFSFCVLLVLFASVGANEAESDIKKIGIVDGKTYFVDSILRNYTASRCFCKNNGMKLATITSELQADLLKSLNNATFFSGWYWVGARDLDGDGNFTWTETGENVNVFRTLDMAGWNNEDEVNNCLCYSANNQQKAYYFKRACHHEHYAICQLVSGKIRKKIISTQKTNVSLSGFMDIK